MIPDPARAQFAIDVRATLTGLEAQTRMALADQIDAAVARIEDRLGVAIEEAKSLERAKCAVIAYRYWWLGGTIIAGKLWTDAGG